MDMRFWAALFKMRGIPSEAKMAALRDGLGGEEIVQSGMGTTLSPYFTGSVVSESKVMGTTFVGTGSAVITGNVLSASRILSPAGAGSPTTWGLAVQAGSSIASNVAVWVPFGTAFATVPAVILQLMNGSIALSGAATTGSPIVAGSFAFLGNSGTQYAWVAVGTL